MRTHSTSTRIRRTVAVVVAGVATGLLATVAVAANDRPETPSIRELQVERAEIADWANEHRLSGLSPASLGPVGGDESSPSQLAAELAAIAEWAKAQGLSGLSPASLRPVGG